MGTVFEDDAPSSLHQSFAQGITAASNYQIDVKELMKAVKILAKEQDLKATLKYSTAGGAIAGVSTVVGGLVLTPLGLTAVGAVLGAGIGSVTSFALFKDKYISLVEIIDKLPENEKQKLYQHLKTGLKNINIVNTVKFLALFSTRDELLITTLKFLMTTYHTHLFQMA